MLSELSRAFIPCTRPNCGFLSRSNPDCDTIKVDSSRFDKDHRGALDKENFYQPPRQPSVCKDASSPYKPGPEKVSLEVAAFQSAMKERQQQEDMRAKAVDDALRKEAAHRAEDRRLNMLRLEEVRESFKLVERMAEEKQEQSRAEAKNELRQAKLQRITEEQETELEAKQEAERAKKEEQERASKAAKDKKELDDFLYIHGYSGVNAKRSRLLKSKYPLHTAVKDNSINEIELLLAAKADPTLKNSAGLTPAHFAMKLNGDGSHNEAIEALQKIRDAETK